MSTFLTIILKKIIAYVIVMGFVSLSINLINKLNKKAKAKANVKSESGVYTVKVPTAVAGVFLANALVGILAFFVFLFFYLRGNPTTTSGR